MEEFCWIPICNPELFVESKDCLLLRIRSVNDTSELCLLARLLCLGNGSRAFFVLGNGPFVWLRLYGIQAWPSLLPYLMARR